MFQTNTLSCTEKPLRLTVMLFNMLRLSGPLSTVEFLAWPSSWELLSTLAFCSSNSFEEGNDPLIIWVSDLGTVSSCLATMVPVEFSTLIEDPNKQHYWQYWADQCFNQSCRLIKNLSYRNMKQWKSSWRHNKFCTITTGYHWAKEFNIIPITTLMSLIYYGRRNTSSKLLCGKWHRQCGTIQFSLLEECWS